MVENRSLGQKLDWAVYITFFVVVLCLPLLTDDVFWLNRISKFLVFGLLGLAIALSWGYAGVLNLGQGLFFGLDPDNTGLHRPKRHSPLLFHRVRNGRKWF